MESKNKVLMGIIVAVVIIFAAVGTYLVFSKISEDEKVQRDSNSNSQEEQAISIDKSDTVVFSLMNFLEDRDYPFYQAKKTTVSSLNIETKYTLAFKKLGTDITITCDRSTLDEGSGLESCWSFHFEIKEEAVALAFANAFGQGVVPDKIEKEIEFPLSTDIKLKDLHVEKGLEEAIENETFSSVASATLKYDEEKKVYTGNFEIQGGGWSNNGIFSTVESASKKKNRITITEKVIFVDSNPKDVSEPTEYSIYSDYNHTTEIGKIKVSDYDKEGFDTNALVEQYSDNAMTVIYTFEENSDGSYHFVDSRME